MKLSSLLRGAAKGFLAALLVVLPLSMAQAQTAPIVFVIVIENHNWTGTGGISGSPYAPYINGTLVPMGAVANNYFNPYGIHPSLPNYLWMEAGRSFGITDDALPSQHHLTTHAHLTELLHNAGIHWKAYDDAVSGSVCPLTPEGAYDSNGNRLYQPRHLGTVYFDDMTAGQNPYSSYCISHVRPMGQLSHDLYYSTIGRYNFLTPSLCHDGHDSCGGNEIAHIDAWLKNTMPIIFNSAQYKAGHVTVFIVGDEAANGDGPIPFIALGHGVKRGYKNDIRYTHSSMLRTLQEIFHVGPLLGYAAYSNDLRDLFWTLP